MLLPVRSAVRSMPLWRTSARSSVALAVPSTRMMSTSPFRPSSPLLLQATQPQLMGMPVIVGCGLIGAYVVTVHTYLYTVV